MNATANQVTEAIQRAVVGSAEGKPRNAALKSVKWVLRSGSMYVGPVKASTLESTLVENRSEALIFDGRDNEELKARFFTALFSAPFTPELL